MQNNHGSNTEFIKSNFITKQLKNKIMKLFVKHLLICKSFGYVRA